jgi:hypothetical protein
MRFQNAVGGALLCALPWAAQAQQPTSEDMNAANNPLTPTLGVNLQDQYTGRA